MSTTYVARTGDTLRSVARAVWGDDAMWYLIAEANGMSVDTALTQNQVLVIPNKVTNIHNNAQTFRPYNPGETIGRVDPTLPPVPQPPQQDDGCGVVGQIVMVAIAAAVVYMTAAAATGAVASLFGTTGAAAGSFASVATYAGGYALAGAAGSIVSQGVGMVMGMQNSINWRAVGQAALSSAIGGGLSASGVVPADLSNFTRGAAIGAMSSGINMALHGTWSWSQLAGSAIGGAIGSEFGASTDPAVLPDPLSGMQDLAGRFVGNWVGSRISTGRAQAASAWVQTLGDALSRAAVTALDLKPWSVQQGARMGQAAREMLGLPPTSAQVAMPVVGNALGQAVADSMKPKADSPYSLAGSGARLGNGAGSVRLGTGDDGSSLGGGGEYPGSQAWADDVATRRAGASAQQVPLRQMLGLFATADDGFSSAQDDMRQQFADVYGDDFGFVQTGGGSNGPGLMRSGGPYRPGSLIELSRNGGRDAAMQGIDDAIAFAGMIGDYRTLGNVMQLRSQVGAMNRELADIDRDLVALGKKPPAIGPDMMASGDELRVLADKLTERRNFVRLVAYENLGVIRLNEDLSIRDIGKDRLNPKDFLKELGQVAERSVAAWAREADGMANRGELSLGRYFFAGDNAEVVAKGDFVDRGYKRDIADWLSNQRVPEGPFGLVSINRRYNDPQSASNYRIPDVLVNYGPREVYALDATLGLKTISTPQVRDALRYGVTQWGNVTRAGLDWIYNTNLPRGRR